MRRATPGASLLPASLPACLAISLAAFAAGVLLATSAPADPVVRDERAKLTATDGALEDYFGVSVALSGDTALVGANWDDDNGTDSGAAYVFHRDGTSWVEQPKLTASDGAEEDQFGTSVALSGDTALVGAHGSDGKGSAYVFDYNGSNWVEQPKLTASDGVAEDRFGVSVALSGDTALVGAHLGTGNGTDSGSAYVFHYDGSNWVEQPKLTASDGADGDRFGISVAVSGDTALVGASGDNDNGGSSGSAYVFHYDGSNWAEETKLTASDGESNDWFGRSVAISGDLAVIGTEPPTDLSGDAYSAYVFRYSGSTWVEEDSLTASDAASSNAFGRSVAVSGEAVLVGAERDDDNGTASGSAYVFYHDGSNWVEQRKLTASDGAVGDRLGVSVAVSGETALVGASGDDDNDTDSGSAYVFAAPEPSLAFLHAAALAALAWVARRAGRRGGS